MLLGLLGIIFPVATEIVLGFQGELSSMCPQALP
jgi:hypothetical protein